jgi:hypothetical protein
MSQGFLSNSGALRAWFRDDIRNVLLSAYATSSALTGGSDPTPETMAFRRGFVSALVAIGLNFGIAPLPFHDQASSTLTDLELGSSAPIGEIDMHSRS